MESNNRRRRANPPKGPRRRVALGGALVHLAHPPPINPQIKHRQRMRYVVTAAVAAQVVSFTNVLDGIIVATSAVTAVQLFDQVRIKAVELWACNPGAVAPVTVQCAFTGDVIGQSGSARVYSDTSVSIEPAHIRAVPDRTSQASQWQPSSVNPAFLLTAPAGCIVDVEVEFRNDNSAPTASAATVAAVAGEVYYRGLDSLAIATTNFVPVALLTR